MKPIIVLAIGLISCFSMTAQGRDRALLNSAVDSVLKEHERLQLPQVRRADAVRGQLREEAAPDARKIRIEVGGAIGDVSVAPRVGFPEEAELDVLDILSGVEISVELESHRRGAEMALGENVTRGLNSETGDHY